jgi:hypothetical protein
MSRHVYILTANRSLLQAAGSIQSRELQHIRRADAIEQPVPWTL